MPETVVINRKKSKSNIEVDKDMRDYTNEPCFIKKAEKAKETIKKYGLPKSVKKKSNA